MASVPSPDATAIAKSTQETVTQLHRWTDTLITFKTTRPANYQFTPGQYSRLGLTADDGMIWRPYSITSAPADDTLEYYGVVVPKGAFTTRLDTMRAGDPIWIEKQLYGFMTIDRFADPEQLNNAETDLWMLATGTGIGPYVSILRDPKVWQAHRRIVLVHGVKFANEFAYHDELLALRNHPPTDTAAPATLHLIQCTTRANDPPPDQLHGRITTLLESGALEEKAGFGINVEVSRIMLCGNPDMIEDTRRILHQRGMRPCRRALPGQFVTENYW